MSIQGVEAEIRIKGQRFNNDILLGNKYFTPAANGFYKIDGLPLNTVIVIALEKGQRKMKNLVFSTAEDTKDIDITPTSTVMVALVSANADSRESLENFDASADISGGLNNIQDAVEIYYESNKTAIDTAIDAGNVDASLPAAGKPNIVASELNITVIPARAGKVSVVGAKKYLSGTKVSLQAFANEGWKFGHWDDNTAAQDETKEEIILTIGDEDIIGSATFSKKIAAEIASADKLTGSFVADGNADEWAAILPLPWNSDYLETVKMVKDAEYLYMLIEFDPAIKERCDMYEVYFTNGLRSESSENIIVPIFDENGFRVMAWKKVEVMPGNITDDCEGTLVADVFEFKIPLAILRDFFGEVIYEISFWLNYFGGGDHERKEAMYSDIRI